MLKFRALHPAEEQLLRFADGELRPSEAASVRQHLEACWSCRSQLDDLERGIGEYVRYHDGVLKNQLPEPPQPWVDLRSRMERLDRRQPASRRTASRWISAAAAVVLALGTAYWFGKPQSVSAASLLQRAVAANPSTAREHRQLRIRTSTRSFVRPVSRRAETPATAPIEALFVAARFNWDDPLSARSYSSWRDQLPSKRDEVETVGGSDPSLYRIRTTTDQGTLAEATLTLRAQDLAPVSETFQFRGSEWVEITEIAAATDVPSPVPPAIAEVRPAETAPVASEATATQDSETAATRELQVIAALHQIGADLGEPIELTRRGSRVIVTATGMEPQRQEQVRSSLARVPGIAVRFEEPKPVAAEPGDNQPSLSVTAPQAPVSTGIEKAVGGRVALERFATRVLDLSESAMARAHALRNLAERFPPSVESALPEPDRALLATLRQEHAQALAGSAAELGGSMRPALATVGAKPVRSPAAEASWNNWQAGAEQLFAAAQETDQLLNVLLAGAASRLAPDRVPSELSTALARFQARATAYREGLKEAMR